jgi:hypothetical protein
MCGAEQVFDFGLAILFATAAVCASALIVKMTIDAFRGI